MNQHQALEALRVVPGFEAFPKEGVTVERLGGMTNIVFRVRAPDTDLLLRVPGHGTDAYIDRAIEAHNAGVAATIGVSPDVFWFDEASGLMLTQYVDAPTMTIERFHTSPGAPERVGHALARLHRSGETFKFRFELFRRIDDYLSVLDAKTVTLPDGYHDALKTAMPLRDVLGRHPADLVPSHCDPICENFLDDEKKMWIIDWEYSGMNDPMWDLGDLSVEARFDDAMDREMMMAYCGGDVRPHDFGRMVVYKALSDLFWTLWGLIQYADGNTVEDFWPYSVERLERCRALMREPSFRGHVEAVRAGP